MKVKVKLLQEHLKGKGMTAADFARDAEIDESEVGKMLGGAAVDFDTARRFILYFTADEAQLLIDWDALGKENPLACEADGECGGGGGSDDGN